MLINGYVLGLLIDIVVCGFRLRQVPLSSMTNVDILAVVLESGIFDCEKVEMYVCM